MSGWVYAEIYIDAAGSRGMLTDIACAEAVDMALYGSAVYVGASAASLLGQGKAGEDGFVLELGHVFAFQLVASVFVKDAPV